MLKDMREYIRPNTGEYSVDPLKRNQHAPDSTLASDRRDLQAYCLSRIDLKWQCAEQYKHAVFTAVSPLIFPTASTRYHNNAHVGEPRRLPRTITMPTIMSFFCIFLFLAGCSSGGTTGTASPPEVPTFKSSFKIVGESGSPVSGATVSVNGTTLPVDAQGVVHLPELPGPVLVVASAPGHLAEPVVTGWEDDGDTLTVRLLSDKGGQRWVMHSAGDMMLGRRYQTPLEGAPLVPVGNAATGARGVVEDIAPAFALGDFRTVNLETSVSDLLLSAKLPGKRFVLNTPTAAMAALNTLGVDVALLANNHTRDYGEEGLHQTLAALDTHGVKHQGASDVESTAYNPLIVSVKGVRVGMLSWTTVTGSIVNDLNPDSVVRLAWEEFKEKERDASLSQSEKAAMWASLVAAYPELQDWVARRGHGGAAMWRDTESSAAIEALKQQADLVVAQLHSGFQYAEAPSKTLRENARAAIDAGADIVICHHPHVTQGFEWYKGRLIAYSLGNFVFDQDFLATFPGFFLRTVWEGTTLVEARLVPTQLSAYRPVPTTGAASLRTMLDVWEKSLLGAQSLDSQAKNVEIAPNAYSVEAHLVRDGSSFLITRDAPPRRLRSMALAPGKSEALAFEGLVDARLGMGGGAAAILIGRDLFGWGRFEDETVDGSASGATHWTAEGTRKEVVFGNAAEGRGFMRLTRYASNDTSVLVRPVARVPLVEHRLYREDGSPLDPSATYTLRFMARISSSAEARVRFLTYLFEDDDPTADPTSTVLAQRSVNIPLTRGASWQPVEIEIPATVLASAGVRANQLLFYLELFPPAKGTAMLDIDGLEVLEWRAASGMPARFGSYSRVKNVGSSPAAMVFEGLPIVR